MPFCVPVLPEHPIYSALTNCPFSPHFSHFCGLQRPSLLNPQAHFQIAMVPHLPSEIEYNPLRVTAVCKTGNVMLKYFRIFGCYPL